jgi:hypothetical protein
LLFLALTYVSIPLTLLSLRGPFFLTSSLGNVGY